MIDFIACTIAGIIILVVVLLLFARECEESARRERLNKELYKCAELFLKKSPRPFADASTELLMGLEMIFCSTLATSRSDEAFIFLSEASDELHRRQ